MRGRRFINIMGSARSAVSAPVLPTGAAGIWDPTKFVAANKTIPNSATNGTADANLFAAPRRQFNNNYYWGQNAATITDAATTAPDGSSDASIVTSAASVDWFVQASSSQLMVGGGSAVVTNGQTYTMAISVKHLGAGGNFKFGDFNTGVSVLTATTAWQRFTKTFVAGASIIALFRSPDVLTAANFAFCDFQLYAGSADLNPNPLTAPPPSVINGDLILHRDASTVSGGALTHGSTGLIQFTAAQVTGPFTVLYVAARSGANHGLGYAPMLSMMNSTAPYQSFTAGMGVGGTVGAILNGTNLDRSPDPISQSMFSPGDADSLFGAGAGPFVGVNRYDGATSSIFVNGKKIANHAVVVGSVSWKDAVANTLGFVSQNFFTGYDVYYLVYYPRALSNAEVTTAYNAMAAKVALGISDTVIFVGSSITQAVGSQNSYVYQAMPNLSPKRFGANWGHSSWALADVSAISSLIDGIITNGPPSRRYILSCEIGVNDLGIGFAFNGNPNGFTTAYAAFLDARRAAGWKVVAHTIMQRLDTAQTDGGVQFSADRATANTTIRTWAGVHADAIADWASDATMGTNTAPNNATNFQGDKVHPTSAGYTLMEPYTRAAINSL